MSISIVRFRKILKKLQWLPIKHYKLCLRVDKATDCQVPSYLTGGLQSLMSHRDRLCKRPLRRS